MNMQAIALAFLSSITIGGLAWVFLYPLLSGEKKVEQRRAAFSRPDPSPRGGEERTLRSRRAQVEESMKEVEQRRKQNEKIPLAMRIEQAGLSISSRQFIVFSIILGGATLLVTVMTGISPLAGAGFALAAGFGLPRWVLNHLKKRREAKFLAALPDAVDIIVRGIKAGLPLFESIKVVAGDAPEPLRSEFSAIIETQTIGMPLGEACQRLYDRMPVPEANFFGIVIAIQTKSGGNLSEALGNLSKVLRDRKKMKGKIQAMSMEAKASAAIIGALPPLVMLLVYIMTPQYISLLWTHPTGQFMLAGCVLWMTTGIIVMKKMINFDF
ncbi:type II secretion system F family protein [Bradyrhizobium sp. SYSU BS000235]|uniref:type II secretion system F family protein n=1 Tax=Bradyrhizobium sp. SYSU BS000235 TaxID=3411332 RepID=UPI003C728A1C